MSERKRLFLVYGIQRSGNHMLIDWIGASADNDYLHLNNVKIRGGINPTFFILNGTQANNVRNALKQCLHDCQVPNLILSFENIILNDVHNNEKAINHFLEVFGHYPHEYDVLILRDPFNTFASLTKFKNLNRKNAMHFARLWKDYAKVFVEHQESEKIICVNYNLFVSSKNYRNTIANRMQLKSNDSTLNNIAKFNGSSFDKYEYDGIASKMQVMFRWKLMQHNKIFRYMINDREIVELSEKIFGHIPGTEKLHKRSIFPFLH